jgi:hypothetical protein
VAVRVMPCARSAIARVGQDGILLASFGPNPSRLNVVLHPAPGWIYAGAHLDCRAELLVRVSTAKADKNSTTKLKL